MAIDQGVYALLESGPAKAVDRTFRRLQSYFLDLLDELEGDGALLKTDVFNINRADRLIEKMRAELGQLGFNEVIDAELDSLKEMITAIKSESEDLGIGKQFSDTSQEMIRSLFRRSSTATFNVAHQVAQDLDDLVHDSITGMVDFPQITRALVNKLKFRQDQMHSLVSSTLHNFTRQVRTNNARESGVEWYLYDGPQDTINREFCAHCVGRRFTLEMLEGMAGSFGRSLKLVPVAVWLGGYRCRHELVPLVDAKDLKQYEIGAR
uniref:Uncharacterized protein n=1 Tax=viral metagenome TaxID=1070528 RepID=A0A6H1ZFD7_9ZZZZ